MTNGYDVQISSLRKHYVRRDGTLVRAIDDISLTINKGEFVVLLGSSGCGKTTLLRCLAGLEVPDTGMISVNGKIVFDSATGRIVAPERRRIGMMFQSYALWPHMTIRENIRFPLKMQRIDRGVEALKIQRVLEMMRVTELAQQYPNQLSGGQQQRVALARAMVCSDDLILFDEPLSNVDAKVRDHLRTELSLMHKEHGFTAVYVTHDQDEAMALADRIVVLGEGRVWQAGAPAEVYARPSDARVAAFIGAANFLPGKMTTRHGQVVIQTALGDIAGPTVLTDASRLEVILMSRPESWRIDHNPGLPLSWKGRVKLVTHLGPHTDYTIEIAGQELRMRDYGARRLAIGDEVWCAIEPTDLLVLDARRGEAPR